MSLKKAEFAHRSGRSRAAITQAVREGRLTANADSTIDLERGLAELEAGNRGGWGGKRRARPASPRDPWASLNAIEQPFDRGFTTALMLVFYRTQATTAALAV